MADEEDDYLSDKFLVETTPSAASVSKTYSERRRHAAEEGRRKQLSDRLKSRRELEQEAREEGLSKSLFERAQEQDASGAGAGNKALAMMMKMGFKPGQALGKQEDDAPAQDEQGAASDNPAPEDRPSRSTHRTEPLPLNEWAGRKGIGLGKRTLSPTSVESLAKRSKLSEDVGNVESFRDRARREHEEKRAEGQLVKTQRTCRTLDEKAGITFNVLWLDPADADAIPPPLLSALERHAPTLVLARAKATDDTFQSRLAAQMRADALQPAITDWEGDSADDAFRTAKEADDFPPETVEQASQFLRLSSKDRLTLVLDHLRRKYCYCFWCGTEYGDEDDLARNCPGVSEDDHD